MRSVLEVPAVRCPMLCKGAVSTGSHLHLPAMRVRVFVYCKSVTTKRVHSSFTTCKWFLLAVWICISLTASEVEPFKHQYSLLCDLSFFFCVSPWCTSHRRARMSLFWGLEINTLLVILVAIIDSSSFLLILIVLLLGLLCVLNWWTPICDFFHGSKAWNVIMSSKERYWLNLIFLVRFYNIIIFSF